MADPFQLYLSDRSPSIQDVFTINDQVVDVSAKTVTFSMRARGSSTLKIDHATVVKPNGGSDGVVRYDWAAIDVDTVGEYLAWWEVTLAAGVRQSKDAGQVNVDLHGLPSTTSLCELEDVRQYIGIKTNARDELIEDMITAATHAIAMRYQREFAAVGVQTRTFDVSRRLVDLAPYDLQASPTPTLTLDPSGAATVLAATDYQLRPAHSSSGTYYLLRLSRSLPICSSSGFDTVDLTINGTWGFPTIPDDVRRAAAMTAGSWVDRGAESYAMPNMATDGPNPYPARPETWAIPSAAHTLLQRYERMVVA